MKQSSLAHAIVWELNKNSVVFERLCNSPFLSLSSGYSTILGLVGMVLSLLDIIRIIKSGPVLPCALMRARIKPGRIVSPECERDLKLICLVLSFEYYCLLLFGTFASNAMALLPWMILYFFVILAEFLIFILRVFMDGLVLQKQTLLMSIFIIFNWLCVFCNFNRLMGSC